MDKVRRQFDFQSVVPPETEWWFVRRIRSQDWSAEDEADFQAWLTQDYDHIQQFKEVAALYEVMGDRNLYPPDEIERVLADTQVRRGPGLPLAKWRLDLSFGGQWAAGIAAIFVISASLWWWQGLDVQQNAAVYSTVVGEQKVIDLSEGSRIELNTASEIKVRMSANTRRVVMDHGQAVFDVSHDPDRPFEVWTDIGRVRVLGTRFQVDYRGDRIGISVAQGLVGVTTVQPDVGHTGQFYKQLRPGEAVWLSRTEGFSDVLHFDTQAFAPWREGRLVFDDQPLSEVVREVNRYFQGRIQLQGEALGSMKVGGVFHVNDLNAFFDAIEQALPVRVRRMSSKLIVIEPSDEAR